MHNVAHTDGERGKASAAEVNTKEYDALGPKSVAKRVGVSLSTVNRAIRDGKLKAKKYGRRTLVLRTDLDAWLHSLPAA